MNIIKDIINLAKDKNVICFFDMDGTCVEYGVNERPKLLANEPNFFINKRPLRSILKKMKKLSKTKNVTVKILSNCYFDEQRADKISWLKQHASFIKPEDINIIVLNNESYTPKTKDNLKPNRIKSIADSKSEIFMFEDDHGVMRATIKMLPNVHVCHVSCLID